MLRVTPMLKTLGGVTPRSVTAENLTCYRSVTLKGDENMARKRRIHKIAEELGKEYSIRMIDGADCIYQKINSCCDIEISGADSMKKVPEIMVCVWDIEQGDVVNPDNKMLRPHSLEYFWFHGLDELKKELPGVIEKYKNYKQEK